MLLVIARVQRQLQIRHRLELWVVFLQGVDKKLNLCQWELAHAQEARARRDFVAVRSANLRCAKGQAVACKVIQALEGNKDALCKLGAQEAATRATASLRQLFE